MMGRMITVMMAKYETDLIATVNTYSRALTASCGWPKQAENNDTNNPFAGQEL